MPSCVTKVLIPQGMNDLGRSMTGRRILELSLAAIIGCGGLFAAFAPGAAPEAPIHDLSPELTGRSLPTPRLNPASLQNPDFYRNLRISDASRQVANAIMAPTSRAQTFTPRSETRTPEASMEGFAVSPRAQSESGDGWSATALGVQVRVSPDTGAAEPNWWIVGGAGRESYAVSPGSLREYTVAPTPVLAMCARSGNFIWAVKTGRKMNTSSASACTRAGRRDQAALVSFAAMAGLA